ncbi:dicer-like protein 4 isoform X2 [Chenopodium quinoa]|uniref:dicer-like protein 4 isoform X2 n=1 Tax=Chenopodium quinoa TaxID=63459 RepID=UPI000B79A9BF|nr:dicer-like protein 4 isoform X2 [Chenopodium quinoa]
MGDYFPTVNDFSAEIESGITLTPPIPKEDPRIIARKYQLELARKALDENVIVVLETGCGKTLIAILLMCDMAHLIRKHHNNVCIFLAPTVVLVHQQARVIEHFTDFKVGTYCGDDAKHLKTHIGWERELDQYEVLVMTPQVLLRNLCHCFIRMETVALLIFDECHYAQLESNHPYAEIMKVFYDVKVNKVPRIFGMTASPICGKGASINSLQALLHAKVYTVNDKRELETVVVSPVVEVYHYSSSEIMSSSQKRCLDKLEEVKRQCTSMLSRTGDDLARVQNTKKLLQKLHNNMVFSLTSLGLWGALQACHILLNGGVWERDELIDAKGNSSDDLLQNEYLAQTASLLDAECMGEVTEGTADMVCKKLREPFFSQKVLRLVGILSNFRSRPDMKCIIFVNRIIIARSLAYILGQINILSAWKCDYLVGVHSKRMSRKTMYNILEEFRSGKLNLLVATKVGEEGLDIQTCCLVIRFDLPETLASFIQSRGRARMPQSEYVFLVDSESEREMNLMDSFRKDENLMNMNIRDRKPNGVIANNKEEIYSVGSTGATISTQTGVSLLYHYCSKLPHDEYFAPMPDFYNVDDTEGIICHIILPSNAPINHIVSAPQSSKEAAKKDACLRACEELHQVGALTEYLLPEQDDVRESHDVSDSESTEDEDSPYELQEMVIPAALKEPLSDVDNLVCLNSYFIRFKPKPHDRKYKDFGLFIKSPLPYEAEQMKIDLHLAHGRSVLTDLVPSGVAEFSKEEMLQALNFQEMCLKIILDRSEFMCGHVPLEKNKANESSSSVFYLLLPVISRQYDSSISVDWMTIRRCLSSPIFAPPDHLADTCISLDSHLQLADGPASVNDILNSLIYVDHRKSFFFVSKILPDKNGYSLVNSSTSHIDHLSEKFKINLIHPGQPLLQVKQLFCLHNLLHDCATGKSESHELDEYFFELPPELCELKIIGFSKDIGSSLSLLPSVMHRLESFLVALELKEMLSKSFTEGVVVTAERVFEALTTERCHEGFSLERLEVLGDSFLKFAVGRHLFLKHEAFDEGQLTRRRSNLVNNSNLCKLAIKNKLQGYIRDQEFDPSQFYALGRTCSVICTKQTESSIHCVSEDRILVDNRQVRCSKNHQWLTKKTIADVVEALIGAYIVDSGFKSAIAFLGWFGIHIEFEISQVCHAWTASSRFMSLANRISISEIEGILGHHFVHRGLGLQAFVHPSYNKHGGGCYQRLEFLGDAVLDYLITSYLYSVFPDLKPGQLTDLRASLVNNDSFAQAAANALYKFILCENSNLSSAIDKYLDFIRKPASERSVLEEPSCPKALGDLVESCFGAVLLDSGFDLCHVWKVMHSFMNPIMKYANLHFIPTRELKELCQYHGLNLEYVKSKRNRSFMVEAIVNGQSFHVAESAMYRNTKGAKRMAARKAIEKLKAQGYRLKTSLEEVLKTLRTMEPRLVGYDEMPLSLVSSSDLPNVGNLCLLEDYSHTFMNPELTFRNLSSNDCPVLNDRASPEPNVYEMPTIVSSSQKNSTRAPLSLYKRQQHSQHTGDENLNIDSDVHGSLGKATAKSRLNEICVRNCWKPPLYECCKEEGPSHLKLFTFKVMVVIEEAEDVILECFGQPQAKKKAAAEEAAEGALWLLKKEGYIR